MEEDPSVQRLRTSTKNGEREREGGVGGGSGERDVALGAADPG